MLVESIRSNASFSDCGKYRWSLTRVFDESKKGLVFIGLNPSLATSSENDPTLRRLIRFSKTWGYSSLHVLNLFAKITNRPNMLRTCCDPIGQKNDFELERNIRLWSENNSYDLLLGWGVNGKFMNRNKQILNIISKSSSRRPYVIGLTKEGHPSHPLYLPSNSKLFYFPFA